MNGSITTNKLKRTVKKLFLNVLNPQRRLITFKSGSIKIYEIEPDYGIR